MGQRDGAKGMGREAVAYELSAAGLDPVIWLDKAASAPGIHYLSLDRRSLIQSVRLPGDPPGDPADRMLIATAQLTPASLITCDEAIISYARERGGLSVCDARK